MTTSTTIRRFGTRFKTVVLFYSRLDAVTNQLRTSGYQLHFVDCEMTGNIETTLFAIVDSLKIPRIAKMRVGSTEPARGRGDPLVWFRNGHSSRRLALLDPSPDWLRPGFAVRVLPGSPFVPTDCSRVEHQPCHPQECCESGPSV